MSWLTWTGVLASASQMWSLMICTVCCLLLWGDAPAELVVAGSSLMILAAEPLPLVNEEMFEVDIDVFSAEVSGRFSEEVEAVARA